MLLRNDHQFVDGAGRVDDSMAGPCFDIVTKYDNTSSRAWPNWGRAPNGCCALVLILLKSGQVFELIKMSWRWRMTSLNGFVSEFGKNRTLNFQASRMKKTSEDFAGLGVEPLNKNAVVAFADQPPHHRSSSTIFELFCYLGCFCCSTAPQPQLMKLCRRNTIFRRWAWNPHLVACQIPNCEAWPPMA